MAGAVALAGLPVLAHDARHVFNGLTSGLGLVAVIASGLAGLGTLALVWWSRFRLARVSAAVAVAAIIAVWAAAQRPAVLPGLTLHEAAAARATLIAVIIAVLAGGLILAPSLGLPFLLTVLENDVAHGFGMVALLTAAVLTFRAVQPADLWAEIPGREPRRRASACLVCRTRLARRRTDGGRNGARGWARRRQRTGRVSCVGGLWVRTTAVLNGRGRCGRAGGCVDLFWLCLAADPAAGQQDCGCQRSEKWTEIGHG